MHRGDAPIVATQRRAIAVPGAAGNVRLIGGQWKRTPIAVPTVPGLRPTPDRVRETLFNWLAHLKPDFGAMRGLDLFAGTGALGFELASRGALRVVLVEREPRLVAALRALKEKLRADNIDVRGGDAFSVAASLESGAFDLVMLDPPYASGLLWTAIDRCTRLLTPAGLVYAESATSITPQDALEHGLVRVRNSQAGRVHFCLLARAAS